MCKASSDSQLPAIRAVLEKYIASSRQNAERYNPSEVSKYDNSVWFESGLYIFVCITADPPVCRIADYQKFLYQQKKKAKELKANQVKVTVKEIRFGPQTDDHDYNFKLKHAMNVLKEGSKVKAYVFFRGRSIVFKEQGEILLLRFATDLEEVAKVEMMPKLDGKKMNMMLAPKSKK